MENNLSIIFIVVSILLCLACLFFLFKKFSKNYHEYRALLVGVLIFIIFVYIVENIFNTVIITTFGLATKPVIYVIYGALAAGLFEETGRLLAFKKFTSSDKRESLMYGLGHGGIEMLFIVISLISNLVLLIQINAQGVDAVVAGSDTMLATVNSLLGVNSYLFLISGIERVFTIIFHISLSVIVFKAVKERKIAYYFLAIFMHMFVDMFAAAYQVGILTNIMLVEVIVALISVLAALYARKLYRQLA